MIRRCAAALLLLLPAPALAARRPFIVAYDTATLAEGDVELETWLDYYSLQTAEPGTGKVGEWKWWLGPRWAPFEGVEVAALTVFAQGFEPPPAGSAVQIWAELLEARWRVIEGRFGGLALQLDLRIPIANDLPWQLAPSVSYSARVSRFTFAAQVGYAAGLPGAWGRWHDDPNDPTVKADTYHWITWAGGAAVTAVEGMVGPLVQIGVEAFGQGVIAGKNDLTDSGPTANVGPTLTLAKGRLWVSLGCLFGLGDASPAQFVRGTVGLAL